MKIKSSQDFVAMVNLSLAGIELLHEAVVMTNYLFAEMKLPQEVGTGAN